MIKSIKKFATDIGDAIFFAKLGLVRDTRKALDKHPLRFLIKEIVMKQANRNGIEKMLSQAEEKSKNPSLMMYKGNVSAETLIADYISQARAYQCDCGMEVSHQRINDIYSTLYENVTRSAENYADKFTVEADNLLHNPLRTAEDIEKAKQYVDLVGSHYQPLSDQYQKKLIENSIATKQGMGTK